MPAQNDLRVGLAVFFRESGENRLLKQGPVPVSQRIPCHQAGAVFGKPVHRLFVRIVGMGFHLDHMGFDLTFRKQLLQLFIMEIGNADGLDLSFPISLLQQAVAAHEVSCWLMKIQKIDVIRIQKLQALVHRTGLLILAGPQLGRKENLTAGYSGLLHSPFHGAFVHVAVCRVDHAVSQSERVINGLLRLLRRHQKGTQPHGGHLNSITQCKFHHGIIPPCL